VTQAFADKLKGAAPRGSDTRDWTDVPGVYRDDEKTLALSPEITKGGIYHEVGHAWDAASGFASRTDEFMEAYKKDMEGKEYWHGPRVYYMMEGRAGPSETFAELFAEASGKSSYTPERLKELGALSEDFPESRKIIDKLIAERTAAGAEAEAALPSSEREATDPVPPPSVQEDAIRAYEDYLRDQGDGPEAEELLINDKGVQSEIRSVLRSELADEDRKVWTRASSEALEGILEDGRFKTQFETNTSGGMLDNSIRAEHEEKVFKYDPDLTPDRRPVYGYATKDENGHYLDDGVSQYGNIAIQLKDDVKDRATFTIGDSLATWDAPPVPQDYENIDYHAIRPQQALEAARLVMSGDSFNLDQFVEDNYLNYVEAQVHGGLKLDDVKEIVFYTSDDYVNFHKQLNDLGISHRMAGETAEQSAAALKEETDRIAAKLAQPELPFEEKP
jgi:hypothetical protein